MLYLMPMPIFTTSHEKKWVLNAVESVWTIDLAYLLRQLSNDQVSLPKLDFARRTQLLIPNLSPGRDEGWDFTYYTSTIGVDAAHSKEKFYRKVPHLQGCTIFHDFDLLCLALS